MVVSVRRAIASSRVTRGRVFDNSGANRMFFSTSARARSKMSSEISTTTAVIPCRTRSVTTPVPILPAPITPIVSRVISKPALHRALSSLLTA